MCNLFSQTGDGIHWRQIETIELYNTGTSLGFGIVGGKNTGVIVKTILAGGTADKVYIYFSRQGIDLYLTPLGYSSFLQKKNSLQRNLALTENICCLLLEQTERLTAHSFARFSGKPETLEAQTFLTLELEDFADFAKKLFPNQLGKLS